MLPYIPSKHQANQHKAANIRAARRPLSPKTTSGLIVSIWHQPSLLGTACRSVVVQLTKAVEVLSSTSDPFISTIERKVIDWAEDIKHNSIK